MKRIAILGGGLAGLATAWELSRSGEPFDITVYQIGWRLGGKGASGRRAEASNRIEEHGLHAFSGLYENAFAMMRDAYEVAGAQTPGHPWTWTQAFRPCRRIVLHEQFRGRVVPWVLRLPTNAELPGHHDPNLALSPWTYLEILRDTIQLLRGGDVPERVRPPGRDRRAGPLGRATITLIRRTFETAARPILACAQKLLERRWSHVAEHVENDATRIAWIVANFAYGNLRGYIADDVPKRGFTHLDAYDYRVWLSRHIVPDLVDGQSLTTNSPLVGFLYDAQFAYLDGDVERPSFAAGTALQTMFRMAFTWKGAVIWKMQAGMGDVVFAPLYSLLKQRGVKFDFFHEVSSLEAERKQLIRIHLTRQALTRTDYDPLVTIGGLPCWPSQPRWEQIIDAQKYASIDLEAYGTSGIESRTLEVGRDVDEVVLAISLGGLPHVAANLIAQSDEWQKMIQHVRTVRTQASQVWFDHPPEQDHQDTIGVCLAPRRLNTWASMHHLLAAESWNPEMGSLFYFCGVHDERRAAEDPVADTRTLLDQDMEQIAPWAKGQTPRAIYTAPLSNPSDRFVQSAADSARYRLAPHDAGFAHLTLAGDWTRTGFNLGNAECATISGRLAARALCQHHRPRIAGVDP